MKQKRFSIDQIICTLAEAETPGNTIAATKVKYGISQQTLYRWQQKYEDFSVSHTHQSISLKSACYYIYYCPYPLSDVLSPVR